MKTIVLYDSNHHGHHPTYQKLITKILLENGYAVWLVCSGVEEVIQWLKANCTADMLKQLTYLSVSAIPLEKGLRKCFWGMRNWKTAAGCMQRLEAKMGVKPDLVFFLKVDDFTKGLLTGRWVDRVFPYNWSGIYIHLRFPERYKLTFFRKRFYQPFAAFASRKCCRIGILQEDAADHLKRMTSKPIDILPDATDESSPAANRLTEQILQKAKGRKIIGLIGGQDRRKGSFLMFEIAQRCQHKSNWFFLFCGKMNYAKSDREIESLKKIIGNPDALQNCFFHFEHLPDESCFNAVVDLCDVIFAVYRNFPFSSNLMTKAALFNKPLVVSAGNLMARRVEKFDLGASCEPDDIDACIQAIEKVTDHPPAPDGYRNYHYQHSKDRFQSRFRVLIEKSLV
ncbi:hypothetical protein ACFL2S_11025 [Thermodesulfobacteriota bacterium]